MRRRPRSRLPPSEASSSSQTLPQADPTVRHETRISSAAALLDIWVAHHATWSSKAEVILLAAHLAQGTDSASTPCTGHSTRVGA